MWKSTPGSGQDQKHQSVFPQSHTLSSQLLVLRCPNIFFSQTNVFPLSSPPTPQTLFKTEESFHSLPALFNPRVQYRHQPLREDQTVTLWRVIVAATSLVWPPSACTMSNHHHHHPPPIGNTQLTLLTLWPLGFCRPQLPLNFAAHLSEHLFQTCPTPIHPGSAWEEQEMETSHLDTKFSMKPSIQCCLTHSHIPKIVGISQFCSQIGLIHWCAIFLGFVPLMIQNAPLHFPAPITLLSLDLCISPQKISVSTPPAHT